MLRTPIHRPRHAPPAEGARTLGVPPQQGATVVDALVSNATHRPQAPAMRYHGSGEAWETITWEQYLLAVRQVAGGLAELGLDTGRRVAVLSANRPEWHMADLGILSAGCVTVPVYPTSSPSQISYTLRHSEAAACFVDSHAQLGKVLDVRDELPDLRHVIVFDGGHRAGDSSVYTLDEIRAMGADRLLRDPASILERSAAVQPEQLATVVYTSGTTGPPKGAMISHGNILWTLRSVTPGYGIGEGDRLLSFLPLSHIAERMMSDFLPIAVRGETWFASSLSSVPGDLRACRPTVFLAVPRVWEKLREGIEEHVAQQPAPVQAVMERYLNLGLRKTEAEQGGRPLPASMLAVYQTLDRTLGAAIRRQIGLDQAHLTVTAAAPAHPDLIRWFHAIGIRLLELYGQTEGCGTAAANPPDRIRIGTVGTAMPGMALKLAGDGEILVKGKNVCMGYLKDPESTAQLIDPDGWMHSGDTGEFDPDGYLKIIGRKKDLIITAAGKNIAPQGIEIDLRNHPLISEAIVAGEGRRYLSALLTLEARELQRWAQSHNRGDGPGSLHEDPELLAEIQAAIDAVNSRRSHAEGIRKFKVLPHELTSSAGELTPTLKVKRGVVYRNYANIIDDLYAEA